VLEQHPQDRDDREQHGHVADLRRRDVHAAGSVGGAREEVRERLEIRAPDQAHEAVEADQHGDGGHDRHQRVAALEAADQPALDRRAHRQRGHDRAGHREPGRQAGLRERPGHIGGDDAHLRLREVHEPGGPVDQHERQGQGGVDRPRAEAVDDLLHERRHATPR
jgi:hypothetical protein